MIGSELLRRDAEVKFWQSESGHEADLRRSPQLRDRFWFRKVAQERQSQTQL